MALIGSGFDIAKETTYGVAVRRILRSRSARTTPVLFSGVLLATMTGAAAQEATPAKLTQLQVQSELMSFAERLATFLGQSIRDRNSAPMLYSLPTNFLSLRRL
jgi:hypothetical protein